MNFAPGPVEVSKLSRVAVRYCMGGIDAAFDRYPGRFAREECIIEGALADVALDTCLRKIGTDAPWLPGSFLLRLIEEKWASDEVRRDAVAATPDLVRPPRELAGAISALSAVLAALVSRLPETPAPGAVGDVELFRSVGEARASVSAVVAALAQFAALKGLHDSLHMLQVHGARWLDADTPGDPAARAATLELIGRVGQEAVSGTTLPPDAVPVRERVSAACEEAARRIGAGDDTSARYARAMLLGLFTREMPLLDAAIFGVWQAFPLRAFCGLFPLGAVDEPGAAAAREGAIDLADTLCRRLMEHAVWQAIDLDFYTAEQTLWSENAGSMDAMVRFQSGPLARLPSVAADRAILQGIGEAQNAIVQYDRDTAGGQLSPASFEAVRAAFRSLRAPTRTAFLGMDQALKLDFARLMALRDPLETLLKRVPRAWQGLLPPGATTHGPP